MKTNGYLIDAANRRYIVQKSAQFGQQMNYNLRQEIWPGQVATTPIEESELRGVDWRVLTGAASWIRERSNADT